MATFRQMQDRINLDYLNRTDLQNETKRAILRAVKHYEKKKFWFNVTATAIAIGTTSSVVAIPSDFLSLEFATVSDDTLAKNVIIRAYDRIAYKNSTGALSGVVEEVAYFQDKLHFTPKPASATSLTIYYTHSLAVLSADADTNAWTSAGEDLIVHHACADMLANVLRVTDVTQIQSHKAWEREAFETLQEGNMNRIRADLDNAIIGIQHAQRPKTPSNNAAGMGSPTGNPKG